jgi:hypothetical protein
MTKCINYEFCNNYSIQPISDFCMSCGSWFKIGGFGWDKLEIKDCSEECDICNEYVSRKLHFPTKCGHWFCIVCSRNILLFDESRYILNPANYGCPPCPNGCVNPEKGPQCDCVEYDEILDIWEQEHPHEYIVWYNEQNTSLEMGETVYGSCKCPMCRKEYLRG